jgi:hypothetical protein
MRIVASALPMVMFSTSTMLIVGVNGVSPNITKMSGSFESQKGGIHGYK